MMSYFAMNPKSVITRTIFFLAFHVMHIVDICVLWFFDDNICDRNVFVG